MRRRRIIILICFVIVVSGCAIFFSLRKKDKDNYISVAQACKMLTLLNTDMNSLKSVSNHFGENSSGEWYEKYINYMLDMDYLEISQNEPDSKLAEQMYSYGDLKYFLKGRGIDITEAGKVSMNEIENVKDRKSIPLDTFVRIYDYLISVYGGEDAAHTEQMVVAITPANSENVGKWKACTSMGERGFEGISLDRYIDREIRAYVRGNEIIYVIGQISDEVTYRNVWIEYAKKGVIRAYIGGGYREFYTGGVAENVSKQIADIDICDGRVKGITVKESVIGGKVLMASKDGIEIEGYNELPVAEGFKIYKTYGKFCEAEIDDILVGYSVTKFVVEEGRICAALIASNINAANIRVMVMSTGFTSLFHNRISLTSDYDYYVTCGKKKVKHSAGEVVDFFVDSKEVKKQRIRIQPIGKDATMKVLSVEKSYGNPVYRGILEVAKYDEGLVLINDVDIETYLCGVVPSEMPNSFGVEALKVQAVCARSYAYRQLLNNAYAEYGAHVDDSVNFQVYNNVNEMEESKRAVKETYGEVAAYNGETITTYYYSTSCGHTSDKTVWGDNPADTPYLVSKTLNPSHVGLDLSKEDDFRNFIDNTNTADFDYGFGYYRWKVTMPLSEITKSVNEYLFQRYSANPSGIKTLVNGKWVCQDIRDIGQVRNISVESRSNSGAITCMIIEGTKATIRVENELNIRYLLCPRNNEITLLMGDKITFYILPSAFCYLTEYSDNDGFAGYEIRGGGYGHGIGMSQNAVSNMVKAGMHYDEILDYFYEGVELIDVYSLG